MKRISRRYLLVVTTAALGTGCRNLSLKTHCDDDVGLSDLDKRTRIVNAYVDKSTQSDKYCGSCSRFRPGLDPKGCGSCSRIPGRINPRGGCKLWAP